VGGCLRTPKPEARWPLDHGSSHSITNFVPHENYVAMLNAILVRVLAERKLKE
jgi:hypothetical protein